MIIDGTEKAIMSASTLIMTKFLRRSKHFLHYHTPGALCILIALKQEEGVFHKLH